MTRFGAALLAAIGLVAGACASGVEGAQTYTVQADSASPQGRVFQFSAFYPETIKARPGDSIVFENKGTVAPHTISFGIKADRSNSPPPVVPGVGENPAVFLNCVTSEEPSPKLTKCPTNTTETPPAYAGNGYWNVFLVPASAPQGLKKVTMTLAPSIKPGKYTYTCILHGPMAATLDVVSSDADRETPDSVKAELDEQETAARKRADAIPDPNVPANTVAAGWSGGQVAVNEFYPKEISVNAGTKVTWDAFSPFEPHTVTFEAPKNAEAAKYIAPSGAKSGGSYAGGPANSGIFGAKGTPFPAGPFTLTFTKPGTYQYVCVLHPGQVGTVKVT